MLTVVSPSELKEAEARLIQTGTSEDELIFRAASALAKKATQLAGGGRILVVAGKGNNGCDGLEAAGILLKNGESVEVFCFFDGNDGNRKRVENLKKTSVPIVDKIEPGKYALILDCIFGIGLSRKPEGRYESAINAINAAKATVLSADVPSGLDAEDGEAFGAVVNADYTLTFSYVKSGLLLGVGRSFCGEIEVAEIGIPCKALGYVTDERAASLPARKIASHKGNYGRVSIIGGSENMVGAPLMSFESAAAAARSGAGLTTLCVPEEARAAYQARVKEEMLRLLPSKNGKITYDEPVLDEIMLSSNAIAVGMGMGKSKDVAKTVKKLAERFDGVLVVDADGLNSVCDDVELLKEHRCTLILTPHIGEFNRLDSSSGSLVYRAKRLAKRLNCIIALKSATTVITDGEEVFFSVTGTPALAKGGSGDVLAGMTAAIACVLPPLNATVAACYHFGKAAERAVKRLNSEVSVLASDVIIEIAKD